MASIPQLTSAITTLAEFFTKTPLDEIALDLYQLFVETEGKFPCARRLMGDGYERVVVFDATTLAPISEVEPGGYLTLPRKRGKFVVAVYQFSHYEDGPGEILQIHM